MPSSVVRRFADPDDYTAAIRASRGAELLVTGPGQFAAKLVRFDFHQLWMQRFQESLPRIGHSAVSPDRAVVMIRTRPGPGLSLNGIEMAPNGIIRLSERHAFFQRSSGPACFATMSLPVEAMVTAGAAIAGCDLMPPLDALTVIAPEAATARLQRLHEAAEHLADDSPEVIANPEAARGLEQSLLHALVDCLGTGHVHADTASQRRHATIMRRFRVVLEQNADSALYVPELCAAIGVSDRTLRTCCQEALGVSPLRYLWLRRMHLVRRALTVADPAAATVTATAAAYGFWEFGRFAVTYRALFGESPSATLRRPCDSSVPQRRAAGIPIAAVA